MAWTDRYVTPTGAGAHDGTSEANAWTLAEAIAGVAAGHRVNIKAGTYSNTTTTRTFATAGTTTAPIWWRGYKTTIGDMDTASHGTFASGTEVPAITFTTGQFSITTSHQWFTNLDVDSACTTSGGAVVNSSAGTFTRYGRLRIRNTAANANARALSCNGSASVWSCYLQATTTATHAFLLGSNSVAVGCRVSGGASGVNVATNATVAFCLITGFTTHGIEMTSASAMCVLNNTIVGPGSGSGDGIRISSIPTIATVANNLIASAGVYDINNSTGTNTNAVSRFNNASYAPGTGHENGFGDAPAFNDLTESSSPFSNAAGGDYSLLSTALSKAGAFPGAFENDTNTGYLDVGAVQRQEAAGGSGPIIVGG